VRRHLEEVATSDVENNEISIGLYKDVSSFIKGNENKLLRHIINEHPVYRVLKLKQKLEMTKQKLEKTEDDNSTLGERNRVLERQKTKLQERWTRAHFMRMDMLAQNASLRARQKVLAQELCVLKEGVLQEQRDENACLAAENIGLKKARAAANMNLDEKPDQNPGLTCPLTLELFKNAVYCSDEHTYERAAITKWLRKKGTSPLTREVLEIIGPNRAIQDAIDALTPSP
jgi:DNA repair exonuclease SbcCD ATPase subunit